MTRSLGRAVTVAVVVLMITSGAGAALSQGPAGIGASGGAAAVDGDTAQSSTVRLRVVVRGTTAEGVTPTADRSRRERRQAVAAELGLDVTDVRVRERAEGGDVVEIFAGNVSRRAVVDALEAAGYDASTGRIREGVTNRTLRTVRDVLRRRVEAAGLSGGRVRLVRTADGRRAVIVAVPDADPAAVREVVRPPGRVAVVAEYPVETGNRTVYRHRTVLSQGDFDAVGPVRRGRGGTPWVSVTLTEAAARRFADAMQQRGFTGEGVGNCREQDRPDDPGYCLHTVVDGERVYTAALSPGLAEQLRRGTFASDPTFRLTTANLSAARDLKLYLESGALPSSIVVERAEADGRTRRAADDSGGATETPGGATPGFGWLASLTALAAVGLYARRRPGS